MTIETYPRHEDMEKWYAQDHVYKGRSMAPYVVILKDWLSEDVCRDMVRMVSDIEPYSAEGCGATTQEIPEDRLVWHFDAVRDAVKYANDHTFKYDIWPTMCAWMQTYGPGDEYPHHWDHIPGQSRKLTALVLLSDDTEYTGGVLQFCVPGTTWVAPRGIGTIFVYPSWMPHLVSPVISGERKTLNLGIWGPHFK